MFSFAAVAKLVSYQDPDDVDDIDDEAVDGGDHHVQIFKADVTVEEPKVQEVTKMH